MGPLENVCTSTDSYTREKDNNVNAARYVRYTRISE